MEGITMADRRCEVHKGCNSPVAGCVVLHALRDASFLGEAKRTCAAHRTEAELDAANRGLTTSFVSNSWDRTGGKGETNG